MDRFHLMTVFVAVAEEEGFAGAARRLNMSPPAVTRAIAGLEAHLGVKLFKRTTRFVRLTDAGQGYLENVKRVIAAADEADMQAAGGNAEPRGLLTITAPVMFGRLHVMPGVVAYMQRYPAMQVSALFADRIVNLLEEGIDVAFRIGELPDSSYRAIRVGEVRRVLCATPAYLAQRGVPETPEEMSAHQIVLANSINQTSELKFGKAPLSLRVKPLLVVSDNASAIEAALSGLGIVSVLSYQIAPHLAAGSLKIILSEYERPALPVHIVHSEGRYGAAKVRAFIDLMVEHLRENLRVRA
jgi:DNA-binding transcriptional LysR family regulator